MKKYLLLLHLLLIMLVLNSVAQNNPNYHAYLGKKITDPSLQKFLSQFHFSDSVNLPRFTFYNYRDNGINLRVGKDGTVTHIFLYNEDVEGFKKFKGTLPLGISFNLKRKEIESKIGEPLRSGGGGYTNIYCIYKNDISITYNTQDINDHNATIDVIGIISD